MAKAQKNTMHWAALAMALCCCLLLSSGVILGARGQRGGGDSDNDDFDDSGFDDSGYASAPQSHDAEGSHHQPSQYSPSSEEDLDDDDDVDESTNVLAKVSSPQQFYAPASSVLLPLAPSVGNNRRQKRSIGETLASRPLVRKKRHYHKKKYIGPVYTFVKTNKHAHYKWGVKHKVGKHYG